MDRNRRFHGSETVIGIALLLTTAACTAGDPFGLYHPYHEKEAATAERNASFAAHQIEYGTHERCRRKLAQFVAEGGPDAQVGEVVRISPLEAVGYRRFALEGGSTIQEYRCLGKSMHFRAWVEPGGAAHH